MSPKIKKQKQQRTGHRALLKHWQRLQGPPISGTTGRKANELSEGRGNADMLSASQRDWLFPGLWPCPTVSSRQAIAGRWTGLAGSTGNTPRPVCQLQASMSNAKRPCWVWIAAVQGNTGPEMMRDLPTGKQHVGSRVRQAGIGEATGSAPRAVATPPEQSFLLTMPPELHCGCQDKVCKSHLKQKQAWRLLPQATSCLESGEVTSSSSYPDQETPSKGMPWCGI